MWCILCFMFPRFIHMFNLQLWNWISSFVGFCIFRLLPFVASTWNLNQSALASIQFPLTMFIAIFWTLCCSITWKRGLASLDPHANFIILETKLELLEEFPWMFWDIQFVRFVHLIFPSVKNSKFTSCSWV